MDIELMMIVDPSMTLRGSIDKPLLLKHTRRIFFSSFIPMKDVRYLYILGTSESAEIAELKELKLGPGFYVGDHGRWVLALCCHQADILSALSRCGAKLELLDIRFTPFHELDLSGLSGIRELNISQNPCLHLVMGLESMRQIYWLDLASTAFGPELDLRQMNSLECLDVSNSAITKILLDHDLPQMHDFFAYGSTIFNFAFLRHFPSLNTLGLASSSATDLPQLSIHSELQTLDLSGCELETFPPLENLKKLSRLQLSNCPITLPEDFIFPSSLEDLYLGHTSIQRIPESIRRLKYLKKLHLGGLQLDTLPDWLPDLGLTIGNSPNSNIYLGGTTVKDIDDMSIFDQPQEVIRQWFEARKQRKNTEIAEEAEQPLNEMKIVFLGDGGAGKTHTIARLLLEGENPDDFDGSSTPGIVITDKTYTIGGRDIQVHYWDFGGQEILHSMHRMFLTNRTLYVVVLNVRDGTQNERARYWLHNIKSFAKDSPVLLVLNQMDQNENASINESDLRAMYPGLTDIVKMSAKTDSAEYFRSNFMEVLQNRIGSFETLGSPFLPAWSRLKERLRTMKEAYIRGTRYNELSAECGVIDSEVTRKALLNWFNDLGVSFCYGGSAKLEDYVILRPDWITNAIYMILFNKMEEVRNGLVSHEAIHRLLRDPSDRIRRVLPGVVYKPEEVEYVLNVVRKFRLSFLVDQDQEFIPMLCQSNSMPVATEYAQDPNTLEFRMEYEYLPNNVLHRLMVELRADLDKDNVWLTGARFVQAANGHSAVVKTEGNTLKIFARSHQEDYPAHFYLNIIRTAIHAINQDMGITEPEEQVAYKADDMVECFSYEMLLGTLKSAEKKCYSTKRRKMVSVEDILMQSPRRVSREQEDLVRSILRVCTQMQADKHYWNVREDIRNTYARNALRNMGYIVSDQTLSGCSASGIQAGELDLEIRLHQNTPWTIYEALNIRGKNKQDLANWDSHLQKLLDNYNPSGLPFLFLVSYTEAGKDEFEAIWNTFYEHIRWHNPTSYERRACTNEPTLEGIGYLRYTKMLKCRYDRNGSPTTVYHIFVRLGA